MSRRPWDAFWSDDPSKSRATGAPGGGHSYSSPQLSRLAGRRAVPQVTDAELGPTFSSFMYKLGLTPITGKRGTTSRLRSQLHLLFSTTIRCSYSDEDEGHAAGVGYTVPHRHPRP